MLPVAFAHRMKTQLGERFLEFEQALAQPAPVSLRINPKKGAPPPQAQPVPWCSTGFYLNERPLFTLDPTLHAGAYYVQEASSMLIEQAIHQRVPNQPLLALDLCAAPGGKSTHLLSLLHEDSLLISNETIRTRASVLAENICKWGYPNAVVTSNDPKDFASLNGWFDLILVDAPCSGEGLFRKDAAAATEWSEANAELCALRQRRILNDMWPALQENGLLIYCTCTFNAAENEENLQWLAQQQPVDFVDLKLADEWGIDEVRVGNAIGYRCYPHKLRGEGFFLSVMRKPKGENAPHLRLRKPLVVVPEKIRVQVEKWMRQPDKFIVHEINDMLVATPRNWQAELEKISEHLNVVTRGTAIATLKHDKLVPEHAWALSTELSPQALDLVEADEATALAYLRKDNLHIESTTKGFALVTYKQLPLGWINRLGNRTNNLYPANWRIRIR